MTARGNLQILLSFKFNKYTKQIYYLFFNVNLMYVKSIIIIILQKNSKNYSIQKVMFILNFFKVS